MSKNTKPATEADTFTSATFVDVAVPQGNGGETHQQAEEGVPVLTTAQGAPFSDDQNSLKVGARGPVALEDHHMREKSSTSIMSAFQSGLCTRAATAPMGFLKPMTRWPT